MSDPNDAPAFDLDAILARHADYVARASALLETNKQSLFAVLAAASITKVEVRFDGCGDSGQIEEIDLFTGTDSVAAPTDPIVLLRADHRSDTPREEELSPSDAIETLCYDLLAQTHIGWEDGSGAYGEFIFDVATGQIELDFNYRIETSEPHWHSF